MLRWDLQYHPGIRAEERRVKQKKIGVIDPEPRCWNSKSSMALTIFFFRIYVLFFIFYFIFCFDFFCVPICSLFDSHGHGNRQKKATFLQF